MDSSVDGEGADSAAAMTCSCYKRVEREEKWRTAVRTQKIGDVRGYGSGAREGEGGKGKEQSQKPRRIRNLTKLFIGS